MSTQGQFNAKNPTIKRILKEATELSTSPPSHIHAAPLESNIFEWHFTIRGPPAPSAFSDGIYHGRIVLPPSYPLRPPSFRFLTPSGRFEVNREICLSISGHHEESWQPAWGIRTALVAIRSFMDTEAKGQLGGVDTSEAIRKKFAAESRSWKCPTCKGGNNADIMAQVDAEAKLVGGGADDALARREEDQVPEELRLGYKDDMVEVAAAPSSQASASSSREKFSKTEGTLQQTVPQGQPRPQSESQATQVRQRITAHPTSTSTSIPAGATTTTTQLPSESSRNTRAVLAGTNASAHAQSQIQTQTSPTATAMATATITSSMRPGRRMAHANSKWLDMAIVGISAALSLMIIRKLIGFFIWS